MPSKLKFVDPPNIKGSHFVLLLMKMCAAMPPKK